jgi:glycine cleavage system H protein
VNDALTTAPEQINTQAYDAWLFKLRPADPAAFDGLLDAAAYQKLIGA